MFENSRYATRGVTEVIPLSVQIALWKCIDSLKIEKDYLQVFEVEPKDGFTKITHRQEVPEYSNEYIIEVLVDYKGTIFVIDDRTHSTMLLSSEY